MTKKRFIKLMMARGKQRNEAQKLAENVKIYKTYQALYRSYVPKIVEMFELAMDALKNAFESMASTFWNAMKEEINVRH